MQSTISPLVVVVAAIRSTTAAWLMSELPRQFWVMWQNRRYSILFYFEVPGDSLLADWLHNHPTG